MVTFACLRNRYPIQSVWVNLCRDQSDDPILKCLLRGDMVLIAEIMGHLAIFLALSNDTFKQMTGWKGAPGN